jgi:hypothetical protein
LRETMEFVHISVRPRDSGGWRIVWGMISE